MTPYFADDAVALYHGDCRDILPQLDHVDHVITDPPYADHVHDHAVRGHGYRPGGTTPKSLGFDPMTPELMTAIAGECARLAARWVLVFSDMESGHQWRAALAATELEHVRTGVWVKLHGTPQLTGDRPGSGSEIITIAHRPGQKRWNGGGAAAVWTCPTAFRSGDVIAHTTQKPEALLCELVSLFTNPGDLILDPFAGSGTTGVAAKRLGRRCILIEEQEQYCALAAERLSQGALQMFAEAVP